MESENRAQNLTKREKRIEEVEEEARKAAEAVIAEQRAKLESIAGLTADQAKRDLIRELENEARLEATGLVRRIEEDAVESANWKAKRLLSMTIQRMASDHVVETTVSVLDLPSDDMKGRIIGREGRNIRAVEAATGVDIIIDDTPEAILLSSFDPIRREVARRALERLIQDGRIHPARIEEVVEKVREELWEDVKKAGEAAAFEFGIADLHPEVVKLLGRLKYRTSYGQSVLQHSKEVGWAACHLASELGADVAVAKRAGLLHDIGKAIDREKEGTHLELGRQILKKYGENEAVIHGMECHHGDYEPRTIEAVLVNAADAISAARPGARREILETYVKRLEKLEQIADGMKGVEKYVRDPGGPRAARHRRREEGHRRRVPLDVEGHRQTRSRPSCSTRGRSRSRSSARRGRWSTPSRGRHSSSSATSSASPDGRALGMLEKRHRPRARSTSRS